MILILLVFLMGCVRGDGTLSENCKKRYNASAASKSTDLCAKDTSSLLSCFNSIRTGKDYKPAREQCDVKFISKFMNKRVNPCDDFHEYACGGFSANDKMNTMRDNIQKTLLKSVLEEKCEKQDPQYMKKIKSLYQVCMDKNKIKSSLSSYNNMYSIDWATLNRNWTETQFDLKYLTEKYEKEFIYGLFQVEVQRNTVIDGVKIRKPDFGLPKETLLGPTDSSSVSKYLKYYLDLAVELGADFDTARKDAEEMLDFERQLARIDFKEDKGVKRRVSELQSKYDFVNWLETIRSIIWLGNKKAATINSNTQVIFPDVKFFDELVGVLKNSSKRAIQNYYAFKFARKFLPETTSRIRNIFLQYKETPQSDRFDHCLSTVGRYMRFGLGKMFVDKFYSKDTQTKIRNMAESIRDQFKSLFEKSTWMSQKTKEMMKIRLKAMKFGVGYPETKFEDKDMNNKYANYKVNINDFAMSVNAIYNAEKSNSLNEMFTNNNQIEWPIVPIYNSTWFAQWINQIRYPAIKTMYPIMSTGERSSLSYGTDGYGMADCIGLGFIAILDKRYPGDKIETWMTAKDYASYNKRTKCFENQQTFSNNFYLNQFIASQTGLLATYRAFEAASSTAGEQPLPDLNLNVKQQFFVAQQMAYCNQKIRATLLLRNSKEFAQAFNCPKGSAMNPKAEKCSMWE